MPLDAVTIALIRPSLLGTYGDAGNACVLARRLEWRDVPVVVLSVDGDDPVPRSSDICVLGGGEDRAQECLAADVVLGATLRAAHDAGAVMFGVCAGLQVLGEAFADADGRLRPGLGLLDCRTDGRLTRRAVGEVLVAPGAPGVPVLTGFENHQGTTRLGPGASPLGRVAIGIGNGDGTEGVVGPRIIGTYLHGPVLARNPELADLLLRWVVGDLTPLELPAADRLRNERVGQAHHRRRAWRGGSTQAVLGAGVDTPTPPRVVPP